MNASFFDFHAHSTTKALEQSQTLLKHQNLITPDTIRPNSLRQNIDWLYKAITICETLLLAQ